MKLGWIEYSGKKLKEKQPLPVGSIEFETWSDRIIAASELPAEPGSMKFALATMIMHLDPTVCFKEDAFFIASLRKAAANQVAYAKMEQFRKEEKEKLAAKEAANEISQNTEVSSPSKEVV